jgi:uncharacterized integral membrane protein
VSDHIESTSGENDAKPDLPNLWIMPLLVVAVLATVIMILVFSNTGDTTVNWAEWHIAAPLWVVLLVTFGAGLIGGPLLGRVWGAFRRRRRRLKSERDAIRKAAES